MGDASGRASQFFLISVKDFLVGRQIDSIVYRQLLYCLISKLLCGNGLVLNTLKRGFLSSGQSVPHLPVCFLGLYLQNQSSRYRFPILVELDAIQSIRRLVTWDCPFFRSLLFAELQPQELFHLFLGGLLAFVDFPG